MVMSNLLTNTPLVRRSGSVDRVPAGHREGEDPDPGPRQLQQVQGNLPLSHGHRQT